ncbi:Para-aminobenzoate synthase [Zancudomyces culisetae]|uniref:aminodeoxychorismate synthase n=1 Tax=Zancudomyces culisetae TaxID=1213189 RepID=A0A1R1PI85_ZANCU|nr:Para-aminobenzoate synthase [Zancudomyces culisetae]|eukprot:OMH80562.1 Para-aminobenzoate synthase [Zancudomyces culisetae]
MDEDEQMFCLRTLIIDNYDSYTNNLLWLLARSAGITTPDLQFQSVGDFRHAESNEVNGVIQKKSVKNKEISWECMRKRVILIKNDQYTWEFVKENIIPNVDNVVISPGPGNPSTESDFGICKKVITECHLPIFGICLGFQGIGECYGMKVLKGKSAVHGQQSGLEIVESVDSGEYGAHSGLFSEIPQNAKVTRYHSLVLNGTGSSELKVLAYSRGNIDLMDKDSGRVSTENREIMAIKHRYKPIYGVQFHPESVETEYGDLLMNNFQKLAYTWLQKNKEGHLLTKEIPPSTLHLSLLYHEKETLNVTNPSIIANNQKKGRRFVLGRKIELDSHFYDLSRVTRAVFNCIYADDVLPFILDSSKENVEGNSISIMGSLCSPGSVTVKYNIEDREVDLIKYSVAQEGVKSNLEKRIKLDNMKGMEAGNDTRKCSYWDWAQDELADNLIRGIEFRDLDYVEAGGGAGCSVSGPAFKCGWVGYLGYEMLNESNIVLSQKVEERGQTFNSANSAPGSILSLATQCIVVEKREHRIAVYIYGLATNRNDDEDPSIGFDIWSEANGVLCYTSCEKWINDTHTKLGKDISVFLEKEFNSINRIRTNTNPAAAQRVITASPYIKKEKYINKVAMAQEFIRSGESYQICLTNQFKITANGTAGGQGRSFGHGGLAEAKKIYFDYLRTMNAAPFGAFFYYPKQDKQEDNKDSCEDENINYGAELIIMSCSPERLLSIHQDKKNGGLKAMMKPIKGTAKRIDLNNLHCEHATISGAVADKFAEKPRCCERCLEEATLRDHAIGCELQADIKERAENLMIVDLVRHDLNGVCNPTTTDVPKLISLEKYATVYQLVSTVESSLLDDNVMGVVGRCFPPGSMTGAPKLRSVEILHSVLESEIGNRGVYSGSIGYISACNHGVCDWNVVIRTVIFTPKSCVSRSASGGCNSDGDDTTSHVQIGAGGAITILSDPESEWDEVLIKLEAMLLPLKHYITESNC